MTALSDAPDSADIHQTLPSRRERLRALVRLRTQRQVLLSALAVAVVACTFFAVQTVRAANTPEIVRLGSGTASVETMPVDLFDATGPDTMATPTPRESSLGEGGASYYGKGDGFAGRRTASGEIFDPLMLTAAHRTLPMGSRVRVTNPRNGDSVVVRINDRGPFHGSRVIDLSYAAAREIGLIRSGTGNVRLALIT